MGTIHNRLAAVSLSAMLLFSAVTPAYAAPASVDSEGTALSTTGIMSQVSASAYLVPVERSQSEINGEMVITEVFEVPAGIDPNLLVKENFTLSGYLYSANSIVRTPFVQTKTKEVEVPYSDAVTSGELSDCITALPVNMAYDQDGWQGTLYLNPRTISIQVTEQDTRSRTNKQTKSFELEFNDDSLVPESLNGLPRTGLSWDVASYIEGTTIPSSYIATATYSSRSYYSVDSAWELSAIYSGSVSYEDATNIRYTVTYKGAEIPEGYFVMEGQLVPEGYTVIDGQVTPVAPVEEPEQPKADYVAPLLTVLASVLIFGLISGLGFFLLWAIKKGFIYSRRITVQAQDDVSGEYSTIQKIWIKKKAPAFTIDTLKAPSSQHFLCSMSAPMAKALRGKIINVTADNTVVTKHRVEPLNEKDRYVFSVDLEIVAAGPIDSFSI